MKIRNTARAIIIHEGKLLVFKLRPTDDWYSLPGGKLEGGEYIEDALKREMIEETGVEPVIGKLLVVQDAILEANDIQLIEFFFEVKNTADYVQIDFSKTTHGFEVSEMKFVAPEDESVKIRPSFLPELVKEINQNGIDAFSFRLLKGKDKEKI